MTEAQLGISKKIMTLQARKVYNMWPGIKTMASPKCRLTLKASLSHFRWLHLNPHTCSFQYESRGGGDTNSGQDVTAPDINSFFGSQQKEEKSQNVKILCCGCLNHKLHSYCLHPKDYPGTSTTTSTNDHGKVAATPTIGYSSENSSGTVSQGINFLRCSSHGHRTTRKQCNGWCYQ